MTNRSKKIQKPATSLQEFVTVAFAEDMELAKHYKKILNENEIPAAIRTSQEASTAPGIAVTVPEDNLDEAHILIESQASHDSFYDLAFSDDSYDDSVADLDVDDDMDEDFFGEDF